MIHRMEQHSSQPPIANESRDAAVGLREVKYTISREFLRVLEHSRSTLLVSTYQAGKIAVIGRHSSGLCLSLHNFEKAMGIAVRPQSIAVGARGQIWFLQNSSNLASQVDPVGRYDGCYVTRQSFITGNIHGHELAWSGDELWVVNTLFSCLCTLHDEFSFVPRRQPRFISTLAGEDRCHLNGLAMQDGKPRFVTAMSQTDDAAGWRPTKATSGCVIDVPTSEIVVGGLAMPHSPRLHSGSLWVLNSGAGQLCTIDQRSGKIDIVTGMPGYTRGLAFCGQFAFVGMSKIRETTVFGGVPIAEKRDELRCGVAVVDLVSGQAIAYIEFTSGVEEIFDVQVVPDVQALAFAGPFPDLDGTKDIWLVPPADQIGALTGSRIG